MSGQRPHKRRLFDCGEHGMLDSHEIAQRIGATIQAVYMRAAAGITGAALLQPRNPGGSGNPGRRTTRYTSAALDTPAVPANPIGEGSHAPLDCGWYGVRVRSVL